MLLPLQAHSTRGFVPFLETLPKGQPGAREPGLCFGTVEIQVEGVYIRNSSCQLSVEACTIFLCHTLMSDHDQHEPCVECEYASAGNTCAAR